MLPGPGSLPPPPPLVLLGSPSVPSASPSDPPSSSIGSSVAIVVVIVIATVTVTTCIVVLRRGCCRRRLSCSSFSPRSSLSPMASFSSSSAESGMRPAASAALGASPGDSAAMSSPEMALVSSAQKDSDRARAVASMTHSAEGPVKGAESAASSSVSAVMAMSGEQRLVPSAPSLPEVERLILDLLSLPAVSMKPGRSTGCILCTEKFLPTDVLLVLPVCAHVFHQSCIVNWLRRTVPSCCPSCHAFITMPGPDKTKVAPAFSSDEYDVEAQMLVPTPPGDDVAEAVGGSRGWLRSSLERLSGGWTGCCSYRATAVVVPASSRRNTGSWSQGSSGRLSEDSGCFESEMPLPVQPEEEVPEAVRGSYNWLRSSLVMLSGSWSRWPSFSSHSSAMVLPVSTRHVSENMGPSGHSSIDSFSRRWDLEAATPTPERPSVYDYAKWLFRNSG